MQRAKMQRRSESKSPPAAPTKLFAHRTRDREAFLDCRARRTRCQPLSSGQSFSGKKVQAQKFFSLRLEHYPTPQPLTTCRAERLSFLLLFLLMLLLLLPFVRA